MISRFAYRFSQLFDTYDAQHPWQVTEGLAGILKCVSLGNDYELRGTVFVHKTAVIEQNVITKDLVIVGPGSFIGANCYLRGPVFIDENVKVGAGCEIKQSIIFSNSAVAHFNYIGNSIIGSNVNFEAGSVAANHYNERAVKEISVLLDGVKVATGVTKFGSLVGDDCKIGANAVLSPGTILPKGTVVKRLELVEQA
jgi:UDP-N-acetylglucosamine diphosphorylase / glucose-1-phosphate thymidylyltransferase / UDP-N-acetylgalactosamine diphosphorylase / glucosamine-1-phosphate N-acetyltransferase / galactosamine-1-phosphate N-acetyltransferase